MRFLDDPSIAACDRRISALEHELLELKRHRNALTPICRLPPETLAGILEYVQHGGQACDARDPWRTYSFAWVRVMLVCRHFRDVALGTPQLWMYVDLGRRRWSPIWTQVFLRNAERPVVVRDRSGLGIAQQFFIKAHSVDILVSEQAAISNNFLSRPAPVMESLRFKAGDNVKHINVDASFLGGTATFLHTFCLDNVTFRTNIPDLPSLYLLELSGAYFYPDLTTLMSIIARAPQLRTLCLQDLRPCRPASKSQKELPRSLPDLHDLYIQGSPGCVPQYMRVLPIPSRSLGMILRDVDDEQDRNTERYTYAYTIWTKYAAAHSLDLERVVVLGNETMCAHLNIGQPIPLSEFGTTSSSFFSIHSTTLCSHPILAGIDTVRIRQPLFYDEEPCYEDVDGFGIEAMSDLRIVVIEDLHPVGEARSMTWDGVEHLGLAEDVRLWVMERQGRVTDVRFERCSAAMVAVAEDLKQMEFRVTWCS